MDDNQLLRYSRQLLLPELGAEGQLALAAARVLVVGAGGLGSPAAMYLAAAGVGRLVIADDDRVDLSNLQRQIVHNSDRIGELKVESARRTLHALNPECAVECLAQRLAGRVLQAQAARADVVVDASDNFATRFAVNAACVATGTPLVSGAAIRWEGQLAVFTGMPCYRCLYSEAGEVEERCSENGVIAPLVGVIGSAQALEAIKLITGAGTPAIGRLLLFDALRMEWRSLKLQADPACPVCAGGAV